MSAVGIKAWLPPLIYMAFIICMSHSPPLLEQVAGEAYFPGLDKIAHFMEYSLLGLMVCRARSLSGRPPVAGALFLCLLFAASDEFHQSFLPYRSAELGDFLSDGAGILAAFAFFRWVSEVPGEQGG